MKKKYTPIFILIVVFILVIFAAQRTYQDRQDLVYQDSLDEVAAEVNGTKLTLADIAFYVYYEETEIDRQARLYNPDNPKEYWGVYTQTGFMKSTGAKATIELAIHDEIFYQMAMEEGITLSEEELASLANNQMDVWADITDEGKEEGLGVTKEQIDKTLEKMIYAQKYQTIYALMNNVEYEDYNISTEHYEALLEEQDYKINKAVWDKVPFGEITINYGE